MKLHNLIPGFFICAAMLVVAACGSDSSTSVSTTSGEGFITYDDFTGTDGDSASSTKWTESAFVGPTMTIMSNALEAKITPDGSAPNSNALLFMADGGAPGSTTGIEAGMTATEYTENSGAIRVRVAGRFYNDGTNPAAAPGTSESDIFATLRLQNFVGTTGEVAYVVLRCDDAGCSAFTTLASSIMGTVDINGSATYRIEFDSSTSTFTFTRDITSVTVDMDALGAPFNTAPNFPRIQVGVRGSASPNGSMTATIDSFRCRGCTVP